MGEDLWNQYHEPEKEDPVDEGIHDFTVDRIIDLSQDSILLAFTVSGHGIAQRIYFDSKRCTMAKYLLISVGLLKKVNSGWLTSELANTVGRSGRCIVGMYNNNTENNIETFLAPWCDEKEQWWKYQILKRAGKKCEACGAPGFDAHHLKPKSVYPEEMYDINNGQCLCRECHTKWHNMNGTMAIGGPGR